MRDENNDDYMTSKQLFRGLMSAVEDASRKRIANSISRKLESLAILGYHTGSIVPFGYRMVKVDTDNFGNIVIRNKLIVSPNESLIVKTLFKLANELIDQDKFSYTAIALILNDKGLHRRKSIWTPTNVKSTLINTRYYGVTIYGAKRTKLNSHKKPIEIDCLAIVSKRLFEKVNHFITELRI